ncbi:DUF397 domain-containing protein [Streptomyces sp. A1499]|uniref:DUF397 domain-containing protein n=1 Tax=Streptomyces sp. A1499 TaxID=2563104 RepID=UPI00109E3CED|nr:DUF397 domain-containing protein [Streptomyces sp. A1499]THC51804.1 DUF397 domain-containing protein [Streptomyces sp. A1499]
MSLAWAILTRADRNAIAVRRWRLVTQGGHPVKDPAETAQSAAAEGVGHAWRKSSYSLPEGSCVEIARPDGDQVLFRDSKVTDGPVLRVRARAAESFTSALLRGGLQAEKAAEQGSRVRAHEPCRTPTLQKRP